MRKFANFIVNHKKLIIIFYIIIVVLSLVVRNFVFIEYDLSSYLPKDMESIKGRDILQKEFNIKGTAALMVKGKEFYEIKNLKNEIKNIPGVKDVIWLDDVEDINKPREFMDKNISKRFIKEDYSLLQIQFLEGNDDLSTSKALDQIEKITSGEYYLGGQATTSKDMQDTTSKEILYYSLVAFIIISIILLLSSSSYYEPILFFITIGTAIAINMGTNLIFGKVSSNTHAVASILQLAVSMDYSIFLFNRFHEELNSKDKKEAMIVAIEKTFSSVSASALTTVGGFLALAAMKYGMGKDMGFVLAKGVLLSLLCVVTLMPCLILVTEERFSRYKHKILLPQFNKISKWSVSLRYVVLILAALIAVPAFLAQSKLQYYYSTEKTLWSKSKSVVSNNKIRQVFGKNNELILVIPKGDKTKIKSLIQDIKSMEGIESVEGIYSMIDETIPDMMIPREVKDTFESDKYTYYILNLNYDIEGKETSEGIKEISKMASKYYKEWYLTGEPAVYSDLKEVTSKDFSNVNIISTIIIGLILMVTFKSIMLPLILIFVIQLGIWINLSIPYFQGITLNFISFIIIGAIQLGATVDYAILVTSRYRENLESMLPLEAMEKTIKDTGRSVLTSSLILMAGTFSVSLITTIKSASELTLLIGRGAFLSLLLVYILLPAMLLFFNPLIKYTTIKWPRH